MTPALTLAVERWRQVALALIQDPEHSTPSQRALAWRFLLRWKLQ